MTERKMAETKMNPEEQETFFGSPHIPFHHLLFYPSWFRPQAGPGQSAQSAVQENTEIVSAVRG